MTEQPADADPPLQKSLNWWEQYGVSPDAKPVTCKFCGHAYLKPCSDQPQASLCLNFQVASKAKA